MDFVRLTKLQEKRKHWVSSSKEINFDQGIKKLLTQLYPDNAHFIYELLQNAEDACASEIHFNLDATQLTVEHNGRPFNFADIKSITSIGTSTKLDEETAIGKFGVGFKAVFAYTDTPIIFSNSLKITIKDLFIPYAESTTIPSQRTTFLFPFNNTKMEKGYHEVFAALKKLNEESLLFLSKIQKISWETADKSRTIEKKKLPQNIVEICSTNKSGQPIFSRWLQFTKDVVIHNEKYEKYNCHAGVAFKLITDKKKKKQNLPYWEYLKLKELDQGKVFIFFPAEKETSNFRFHIHAPFASTVARDSIRDCKENIELRDELKNLIIESLSSLCNRKLLTIQSLALFPNDQDSIPPFYRPIQQAIYDAFNHNQLTPTGAGGYEEAQHLYRAPSELTGIMSESTLKKFTNKQKANWVANPKNFPRSNSFVNSLLISHFRWAELAEAMVEHKKDTEEWIQSKEEKDLRKAFDTLGKHYEHFDDTIADYRIVPTIINDKLTFSEAENVYFRQTTDHIPHHVNFVEEKILKHKKTRDAYYKLFFESIGVRTFDEGTQLRLKLEKYSTSTIPSENYHNDLISFIRYWDKHPYSSYINFSDYYLIPSKNSSRLQKGNTICFSSKYTKYQLEKFTSIHNRKVISNDLLSIQDKVGKKTFSHFMDALGVLSKLEIRRTALTIKNPHYGKLTNFWGARKTHNENSIDYTIPHLEDYLSQKSITTSLLIWEAIKEGTRPHTKALYRPNAERAHREADSLLVHTLKTTAWIPNKQGQFCLPQKTDPQLLHPALTYKELLPILEAIEFGKDAFQKAKINAADNEHAQKLGFKDAELARLCAAYTSKFEELGLDPQKELAKLLAQETNRKRQKESCNEEMQNIPIEPEEGIEKKYEYRIRSTRKTKSKTNPEKYLRSIYSQHGNLYCQLCSNIMPFRKRNGDYYFERTEILGKEYFPKEYSIQYLALCPVCSAKFREFIKKDQQASDALYNQLASETNEINVMLDKELYTITFAEKHLHAIRKVINDSQQNAG